MISTGVVRVASMLLPAAVAMAALWFGLSAWVVVNRIFHDWWVRRLSALSRRFETPEMLALPPLERSPTIRYLLAVLPRHRVYSIVVSDTLPTWFTEIGIAFGVERVGLARMKLDAGPQLGGKQRWRRIAALFALAHLEADDLHTLLDEAVQDPDLEIANVAATILHRLGDRRSAEILLAALLRGPLPPARIASRLDRFPIPIEDLVRPLTVDARPDARVWGGSLLLRYPRKEGLADGGARESITDPRQVLHSSRASARAMP